MSSTRVEQFYHEIYSNTHVADEEKITAFFVALNPPPDTLIKIRATAFKVACQYLSSDDSNNDDSKCDVVHKIHCIVNTIDTRCYDLKDGGNRADFDEDTVTTFYNTLFDGAKLDTEENEQLLSFLQANVTSSYIDQARSLLFTIGIQHFINDDTAHNEQVLRCMNVIVHAIETTFYQPKPYHIQLSGNISSSYSSMAASASESIRDDDGGRVESFKEEAATSTSANTYNGDNTDLSAMTLNDAVQQLWNYDANRLVMNDDIQLNVQNGKKPYMKEDAATDPLFTSVESEALHRSTYAAFIHLLDNYTPSTGTAEQITSTERAEIDNFLSIIMETAPMQFCFQYCKAHNILSSESDSPTEFKELLYTIWFEPYTRDGNNLRDSSGFEHVFIGEIQDNEISGFHNWIQFYLQEQKGNIDYRGYVKPRGHNQIGHNSDDHILTLQFAWKSPFTGSYVEKFVGTMFIGVSPEFEMALYTMCFLFGEEENLITLDTGVDIFELVIKCYKIARGKIGTTFPEVNSHYDDNDD